MRTEDFIAKNRLASDGISRTCASVCSDGHGNIYSYGYHYPLLVKVGNAHFVNDAGYSATTAKHIAYARRCGEYCYNYRFAENGGHTKTDKESIKKCVKNEISENIVSIANLSKRAFRQKANLEARNEKLQAGLDYIYSL